jgi:cytochrome b pre-mRNA-processing protein 3
MMRSFLVHLFGSNERRARTDRLLRAITAQARQPAFYEHMAVPDTLDGRFDMMALHGFLVFRALQDLGAGGRRLAQDTTDLMFSAFDDALRSIGVGDMGVPRRVKAMARAYLGRAQAYQAALESDDRGALAAALERNIYRGGAVEPEAIAALAAYVAREAARLKALSLAAFETGELAFGPIMREGA